MFLKNRFRRIRDAARRSVSIRIDPSRVSYYRSMGVKIGEDCSFVGKVDFSSEPYLIKIGDHVRISYDVCFVTHDGGTHVLRKNEPDICIYGPIIIGDWVFIGARSIILPNVKIGSNCIIGGGSVVTKDVPDNEVWAGVPAKKICTIDEYRKKNDGEFTFILHEPYEKKKEILLEQYKDILKNKSRRN